MIIKVKEKFVDSISGKKIYANKAENTTNGLNIDDSISSLSSTIKTKQDKLTFGYDSSNAISSINNSAIAAGGQVVTDVMLTSATNGTTSFVTNGVADLTPLYTYIKSLEDRIAALEAAQGGDGI